MNTKLLLMASFLFLFMKQEAYSQLGFSHEIGVIVGPVMLYSDFGERNNFETNTGNVGIGIGFIHYLNFAYSADCNCYTRESYFNDHFKVRNEIDYHSTNLRHYGKWVAEDRTSDFADYLRSKKGTASVFEIGTQLEYYPLSVRDFEANAFKISPFISLGIHWVSYNAKIETSYPGGLYYGDKYNREAFQLGSGSTFAAVGSVGVRYRLNDTSDLLLDSRWQYYFSNAIDGLDPDVPENKSNEWIYWLNVGYIYYLN